MVKIVDLVPVIPQKDKDIIGDLFRYRIAVQEVENEYIDLAIVEIVKEFEGETLSFLEQLELLVDVSICATRIVVQHNMQFMVKVWG